MSDVVPMDDNSLLATPIASIYLARNHPTESSLTAGASPSSIPSDRMTMKPLSTSTLPPRPSGLAVFVSPLTVLPGSTEPEPATIVINQETGKVVDVIPGQLIRDETSLDTRPYGDLKVDKFVEIPEGRVLLPGLVE